MEPIKIVSVALLVLGIIILVVLTTLGGVIKKTLDDTIYDRLEYEFPKSRDQCYRSTTGKFYDEYYLWNLTNEHAFLYERAEPHFNLTGPYTYTQWYCHFNHSLDKDSGYLRYRTSYEGYRFIPSPDGLPDDVKITNINPAYLGLLRQTGGSDYFFPAVASNQVLLQIITGMQSQQFLSAVWLLNTPAILPGVLTQSINGLVAANVFPSAAGILLDEIETEANFFDDSYTGTNVQSWAYFLQTEYSLTATVVPAIFTDLTNAATLAAVSALESSALETRYTIPADEATHLAEYIDLLLANPFVQANATAVFYENWSGSSTGWLITNPAGISAADARAMLDPSFPCALTNSSSIMAWVGFLLGQSPSLCPAPVAFGGFSFLENPALVGQVLTWFQMYVGGVVAPTQLQIYNTAYGLTNWNDFAYLQWGQGVFPPSPLPVGRRTVQSLLGLNFPPEAAYSGAVFNITYAKDLLNGTRGIFNTTHMTTMLTYVARSQYAQILVDWPAFGGLLPKVSAFLSGYLDGVIIPTVTIPAFRESYLNNGSGLVTTRTAREWLFTAEDELVRELAGDDAAKVALVGNLTRTRQEAENFNYTYYRVYTGKNDLHWSLMPYNNGTNVTYWNGTMLITGYNGTQFLPNGYLDDAKKLEEYPLTLWHRMINRTIPFRVVGKDKWEDVNVRYLTMTDDALLSADKNPVNSLYYAKYSGVIDKTTNPPYLPVFLTTPCFLSAEESFKQNVSFTDNIWLPTYDGATNEFSTHRYSLFLLVEPKLGSTLWGNLPIQVNFKFGPTYFYNITSGFAPIYWNAIGDKASTKDLDTIKDSLYAGETAWKALIGVGVGVGVLMIAGGAIGIVIYRRQKGIKVDA